MQCVCVCILRNIRNLYRSSKIAYYYYRYVPILCYSRNSRNRKFASIDPYTAVDVQINSFAFIYVDKDEYVFIQINDQKKINTFSASLDRFEADFNQDVCIL